jgi:hypothetical protein
MADPMQEQHGEGQEDTGPALYAEDKRAWDNEWLGYTCRLVQIYNKCYVSIPYIVHTG